MKRRLALVLLTLGAVALAQTVSYRLTINGKGYSSTALVVRGETYVPLKALQAAGVRSSVAGGMLTLTLPGSAPPASGGSLAVAALEGCLNEWLFNGIWRVRATDPRKTGADRNGMTYRVEFRNGTQKSGFAPSGTGFAGINLALDDGTTVRAVNVNDLSDPPYLQGAAQAQTLEFFWENTARTPRKLIVLFDPKDPLYASSEVKFSVPNPSLRVDVTCRK